MSQWALKLCRFKLFLSNINSTPVRLVLLFMVAVSVTLAVSDNSAIADILLQSPTSPVEQPPAEQPQQEQPEAQPQTNEPVTEIVSPISPVSPIETETQQQPATVIAPAPVEPQPYQSRERDDAANDAENGESNFILDQAELIDTVVVSTAYIWLCCGFMLLLLIPLVFIFLQIRGRSKILKEEVS